MVYSPTEQPLKRRRRATPFFAQLRWRNMSRQALGIGSELETEAGQLIAVVTGAGSGIGRAIAIALAKSNATLILVGRTLEKLQQVAECAGAKGARVTCCPADLSCSESLRAAEWRLRPAASTARSAATAAAARSPAASRSHPAVASA